MPELSEPAIKLCVTCGEPRSHFIYCRKHYADYMKEYRQKKKEAEEANPNTPVLNLKRALERTLRRAAIDNLEPAFRAISQALLDAQKEKIAEMAENLKIAEIRLTQQEVK